MDVISAVIPRTIEECWKAFTTPARWLTWVTGLHAVRLLDRTPEDLPREVYFEYAAGVWYVLRYDYDLAARVVRWAPRAEDIGGVRGFARFETVPEGTRFVYAVEHDGTRQSLESMLDDSRAFVDAFVESMTT